MFSENIRWEREKKMKKGRRKEDETCYRSRYVCAASSSNKASSPSPNYWDWWKPEKGAPSPSLSDILWPSAGFSLSLPSFIG